MLHLIKSISDTFVDFLKQDPVRPHIPHDLRVGTNRDIFVARKDEQVVRAITCVSYQKSVPTSESELFEQCDTPEVVVFTLYFNAYCVLFIIIQTSRYNYYN